MTFRRVLSTIVLAGVVVGGVVGCGGDSSGAQTDCSLNGCTVTFDRGVDARASILGIEAKLISVKGDQVTLEVGGQRVSVPAGGEGQAEGFNVSVEEITQEHVKVRIAAGGGDGEVGGEN